ncbi:hypothetical protein BOTBODRAFT_36232 [Botryobasidium botryosum FD-172 SS1]|uniref:TauD/TfdA-like domain-containing protein n=1 Tax=Botryobasidium botryosum (strain FD-172 SS1) TaxID=930990 RepID=A0A067M6N6_BOTB1|nr:hypothetical protein BOTBODRAFT_36232 [Botryobasidium botryosum FD-172 SS1]
MTIATTLAPDDVQTTLNFYNPPPSGEKPHTYLDPGKPTTKNWSPVTHDVVIHNARGLEDTFGLDVSGFEFMRHESAEKEFRDDATIKAQYYPEIEKLLKERTGAKRVVIFNHLIRRDYGGKVLDNSTVHGPAFGVHVDHSFEFSRLLAQGVLRGDAERVLKGRFRIINVWRPIGAPVQRDPLAVADWRTLSPEDDLVPVMQIHPERRNEVFNVRHTPRQKWYYLKEQTPSEVTLIKIHDSLEDGRARVGPHSAFNDAGAPADAPERQSIEIRALVCDEE